MIKGIKDYKNKKSVRAKLDSLAGYLYVVRILFENMDIQGLVPDNKKEFIAKRFEFTGVCMEEIYEALCSVNSDYVNRFDLIETDEDRKGSLYKCFVIDAIDDLEYEINNMFLYYQEHKTLSELHEEELNILYNKMNEVSEKEEKYLKIIGDSK